MEGVKVKEMKKPDEGRRRRKMVIVLSPWRVLRASGDCR
jgi:hypothetical protein